MHTDLPLKESEDDKLGRYLFATEIASGLVNSFKENNESIVLGINGTWGSGKSTLINFIIKEVERISTEQKQEIIVLRFNPWMFSGQKELQTVFLKELILKLKNNSEKLKNASKKIAEFLEYLNWVNYVHSGAGEALKSLKNIFKKVGKEKELTELKEDIDNLLIQSKVKLYITIDDIDRLTPSEITDIFQLIKLNGNFANTIFILAYDQDVVKTALKHQFGENGRKYIEKIVQIDYTLPSVSKEDITRIFIDSLSKLFPKGEISQKITELSEKIKSEPFLMFFNSLRDIYRFNNSIKLRLPSIFYELNILDFLLVEALRVFDQEAYQFAISNKDELVYKNSENVNTYSFGLKNENSSQDIISETKFDDITKGILNRLFTINSSEWFNSTSPDDLIREKRIANMNYFDRYFNLQLNNLDIQESLFENFISSKSIEDNLTTLKNVHSKEKLFQFLNWIEIKSKYSEIEQIENIIISTLDYTNFITYKKESFFAYDFDFMTVLRFCARLFSNIPELNRRHEIIYNHITKEKKELKFSSFYVADNIMYAKEQLDDKKLTSNSLWHNLFSNEPKTDNTFIEKVIIQRNKNAKLLFEKELETKNFLNEDEIALILGVVKNNYSEYYDENFHSLIENDNDLIKYLWIVIKRSWMTSNSDVGYQLAIYQFFEGMDYEVIKNRIDKFDLAKFDNDEKKVINLFIKAYEDGFEEKKYYNIDTLAEMGRW